MADTVVIGSRGSQLALTQSNWVADQLRRFHEDIEVEVVEYKTSGDKNLAASLSELGGKGAFTKELEDALLQNKCDLAVHSLKDLPTELPDGLRIACTPTRETIEDSLIYRKRIGTVDDDSDALAFLAKGATVGTSSLRRKAMLLARRPDLNVIEWRGNVDTRLAKLAEGGADAIILASAGLSRLGLIDFSTRPDRVDSRFDALALKPKTWLPAVGQGALAVETRAGDDRIAHLLAPLHDAATFASTAAERAFLNRLGAGCQAPVGAYARVPEGSTLKMIGRVLAKDGSVVVEHQGAGEIDNPRALGVRIAEWCLSHGADKLI
ncbi:MAG: hydroxymethylbilane synthase [Planctomycetes bacterium]|nr:hydroxymethylbilane synthase [Planctomycetota bacterium]MCA8946397.1 hydroxymethylbilane synthase [Planctomycetota bacterium]